MQQRTSAPRKFFVIRHFAAAVHMLCAGLSTRHTTVVRGSLDPALAPRHCHANQDYRESSKRSATGKRGKASNSHESIARRRRRNTNKAAPTNVAHPRRAAPRDYTEFESWSRPLLLRQRSYHFRVCIPRGAPRPTPPMHSVRRRYTERLEASGVCIRQNVVLDTLRERANCQNREIRSIMGLAAIPAMQFVGAGCFWPGAGPRLARRINNPAKDLHVVTVARCLRPAGLAGITVMSGPNQILCQMPARVGKNPIFGPHVSLTRP